MEKNWERNNRRWKARNQADQAARDLKKAEQEKINFSRRQGISELDRAIRAKGLEEQLQAAKEKAEQAERAWRPEAQQEERFQDLKEAQLDSKLEASLQDLKEADQAVLERWVQFEARHEPKSPEEAATEATQPYIYLLGEHLKKWQGDFFVSTPGTPTVELQTKKYRRAVLQEALEAARKKIPGAMEAWEERVEKGRSKLEENEKKLQNSATSWQEQAAIRDGMAQLKGIVESDQKAYRIFKKEKERLDRIESIWEEIEEARKERCLTKAKLAAQAYHGGDQTLWNGLLPQERELHNRELERENQQYAQELGSEEKFLEEIREQLRSEWGKANQLLSLMAGTLTGTQEATIKLLREAQQYYQGRMETLLQRKKMLRWGGMNPEERQEDWKKERELRNAPFLTIVERLNASAESAFQNAKQDRNNVRLWKETQGAAERAAHSWGSLIAERERARETDLEETPFLPKEMEEIQFQENRWHEKAFFAEMQTLVASFKTQEWKSKDLCQVLNQIHGKGMSRLLKAMEKFKSERSEAALAAEPVRKFVFRSKPETNIT